MIGLLAKVGRFAGIHLLAGKAPGALESILGAVGIRVGPMLLIGLYIGHHGVRECVNAIIRGIL